MSRIKASCLARDDRAGRARGVAGVAVIPVIAVMLAMVTPRAAGLPSRSDLLEKPAKGMFLVAGRDLKDPNFARTVVLLVGYGEEGAVGVIVNRPSTARLPDLLPEVEAADELPPVYLGGPVAPAQMLMLVRSSSQPEEADAVFEDIYVSSSRTLLERLASEGGADLRVYAGYAGWAPGQLDWEIERGGWWLIPADAESIFDRDPDDVWPQLIRRTSSPLV